MGNRLGLQLATMETAAVVVDFQDVAKLLASGFFGVARNGLLLAIAGVRDAHVGVVEEAIDGEANADQSRAWAPTRIRQQLIN